MCLTDGQETVAYGSKAQSRFVAFKRYCCFLDGYVEWGFDSPRSTKKDVVKDYIFLSLCLGFLTPVCYE